MTRPRPRLPAPATTDAGDALRAADTVGADPIEEHVAALGAALYGPARVKARMLREVHDGLTDAAETTAERGIGLREAARVAVREFGAVDEVAPEFQRELTIAQARRTALAVVLAVPVLVLLGRLVVTAGPILPYAGELPYAARVAAAHLGGFASAAALFAAGALAVTGTLARHIPTPGRLPLVIAWSGTAASASVAAGALTLTAASLFAGDWPLTVLAGTFALVAHARLAASARACRHCAHLPVNAA